MPADGQLFYNQDTSFRILKHESTVLLSQKQKMILEIMRGLSGFHWTNEYDWLRRKKEKQGERDNFVPTNDLEDSKTTRKRIEEASILSRLKSGGTIDAIDSNFSFWRNGAYYDFNTRIFFGQDIQYISWFFCTGSF